MKIRYSRAIPGLVLISLGAGAQSGTLDRWLSRATRVAVVTITEGRVVNSAPDECAFNYRAHLDQDVRDGSQLTDFVAAEELLIGGPYLLVVSDGLPWASREFATDVPDAEEVSPPKKCRELFRDVIILRNAEIRPIERMLHMTPSVPYQSPSWVRFPVEIFGSPTNTNSVNDHDRIILDAHNINWPPVPFYQHFSLAYVLSAAQNPPN